MKRKFVFLFLCVSLCTQAQDQKIETIQIVADSITYTKNTDFTAKKEFRSNLKEKYNNKDFTYTEEEDEIEETNSTPTNPAFIKGILFFFQYIFPFLLGALIIFIILKTFLGAEMGFFNFKKNKKLIAEKLMYEDEDIHEIDIDVLLKNAINSKEYRLAIRYYYLATLKVLSQNKMIDYHKDKTNSEYLFEIEEAEKRTQFSYLSYVYTYVWYGEFLIDERNFMAIEGKYKSFLNAVK